MDLGDEFWLCVWKVNKMFIGKSDAENVKLLYKFSSEFYPEYPWYVCDYESLQQPEQNYNVNLRRGNLKDYLLWRNGVGPYNINIFDKRKKVWTMIEHTDAFWNNMGW